MKIENGTKIEWTSRAGVLTGVVTDIVLDLNAAGETIPWLMVRDVRNTATRKHESSLRLCGNVGYMKMMKFKVVK